MSWRGKCWQAASKTFLMVPSGRRAYSTQSSTAPVITPWMSQMFASPGGKIAGCGAAAAALMVGSSWLYVQPGQDGAMAATASATGSRAEEDQSRGAALPYDGRQRMLLIAAGVTGATAVSAGAFGFHGLQRVLGPHCPNKDRLVKFWEIASTYQLMHSAALLGCASVPHDGGWPAGISFVAGCLGFSGSIYAFCLSKGKVPAFQMATPLGGLAFIAGWALLALKQLGPARDPPSRA